MRKALPFALVLSIAAGACSSAAPNPTYAEAWALLDDDAANARFEEHVRRIRAEVATLGGEPRWAGSYYHGDGTGINVVLDLAPRSGCAFDWLGCTGTYDRNEGRVLERNGRVELVLERAPLRRPAFPTELALVTWGERRYLVPPGELARFTEDVRAGKEPRKRMQGRWFMARGDDARAVSGDPVVARVVPR